MYFIVLMAFALLLSRDLPIPQMSFFVLATGAQPGPGAGLYATLAIVFGQLIVIGIASAVSTRLTLAKLDGTLEGHDQAANTFTNCQRVLLGMMAAGLVITMVTLPWGPLVRETWGLARFPLIGDLVVLSPFILSLLVAWIVLYPVEVRIRAEAMGYPGVQSASPAERAMSISTPLNDAAAALAASHRPVAAPTRSLGTYLLDKFRHHFLIIAAPMLVILFAKFFIDKYRVALGAEQIAWLPDTALGCVAVSVLVFSPVMLRYIWSTEPLPDGPLRRRFKRICDRIGLRYNDVLLWHTHGMTVNAAVMGFLAPMRYVLVSDALLETMKDEEIEAVFGHEAGHVRHYHLQFFMLFVLVTMYVAGGFIEVLFRNKIILDQGILQVLALATLLACWLFGFGWLSRRFERQADLYGVRCITPDIQTCVNWCPVHRRAENDGGSALDSTSPSARDPASTTGAATVLEYARLEKGGRDSSGVCTSAANVFGRTLSRIADLNGIPRDAPSWRHGSIESRCRLLERFATDPAAVRRFDRDLVLVKIGLVLVSLIGTALAAWLYWREIATLLRSLTS